MHYILVDKFVGIGETQEGQGANTEEFYDCPEGELSNENIEVSIHALAGSGPNASRKRGNNTCGQR